MLASVHVVRVCDLRCESGFYCVWQYHPHHLRPAAGPSEDRHHLENYQVLHQVCIHILLLQICSHSRLPRRHWQILHNHDSIARYHRRRSQGSLGQLVVSAGCDRSPQRLLCSQAWCFRHTSPTNRSSLWRHSRGGCNWGRPKRRSTHTPPSSSHERDDTGVIIVWLRALEQRGPNPNVSAFGCSPESGCPPRGNTRGDSKLLDFSLLVT